MEEETSGKRSKLDISCRIVASSDLYGMFLSSFILEQGDDKHRIPLDQLLLGMPEHENNDIESHPAATLSEKPCHIRLVGGPAKLILRGDLHVRFANVHHEEFVEDGYAKLWIQPGDVVHLVDHKSRTITTASQQPLLPQFTLVCPKHVLELQQAQYSWKDDRTGKIQFADIPTMDLDFLTLPITTTNDFYIPPVPDLKLVVPVGHFRFVDLAETSLFENESDGQKITYRSKPIQTGDRVVLDITPRYEQQDVERSLHTILMRGGEKLTHERLWQLVEARHAIGIPSKKKELLELLQEEDDDDFCWFDRYTVDHYAPLFNNSKNKNDNVIISLQTVFSQTYTIQVYWRALDRRPGGNVDVHTIRYSWDVSGGDDDSSSAKSTAVGTACEYSNCDMAVEFRGPWTPPALTTTDCESLLRSVASKNSTFHIVDTTSVDDQEYDTEWSSVEVLVFARRWHPETNHLYPADFQERVNLLRQSRQEQQQKEPTGSHTTDDSWNQMIRNLADLEAPDVRIPVFRLHQQCVYGPQWNDGRPHQGVIDMYNNRVKGTEEQHSVMTYFSDVIGMDRPKVWCEEKGRAYDDSKHTLRVRVADGNYLQPAVFRDY